MEHLRRWGLADSLREAASLPLTHAQDVVFVTGPFGHEITGFPEAFALFATPRDLVAEPGQQAPQPVVEDPEFHSLGLVLSYEYADSPIVPWDGEPRPEPDVVHYTPSARAGARLPHLWLPDRSSLYDLLGDGFVVAGGADTGSRATRHTAYQCF
jgi:hypothetical protein